MAQLGQSPFRARQLMAWLYKRRVRSVGEITEFAKPLREAISARAYIGSLTLRDRLSSSDGTEKFLFALSDGQCIESVLIPDDERLTLCISSQVGCAMGCAFCRTAQGGITRNLKAHEIAGQVLEAMHLAHPKQITNIVMMGMGEPLMNLDEVVEALWRMTKLMEISPRRITLSTCGIVPKMQEFARRAPHVNLAVSLNAATDAQRDILMPVNQRYPMRELLAACRRYPLDNRRRITFEYVLVRGINDSLQDAKRLVTLLRGIPSKINLIPLNEVPDGTLKRPSDETLDKFLQALVNAKMTALVRKSKGSDILAACGQLRAKTRQG